MAKRFLIPLSATLMLLAWTGLAAARIPLPDITELVDKDGPAVVNISTTKTIKAQENMRDLFEQFHKRGGPMDDFFDQFEKFFGPQGRGGKPHKQRSMGSGFVISADGYIVTNNHVIDNADEVKVQFRNNEKPLSAKIVGRDQETDLALLKIEGRTNLPFLEFGDSSKVKVGAWVLAIGNPFGLENTVTLGIVSAKGRIIGAGPFDNFIQTDASINPGNSGGPLIDLDGKVVGINTAIVASGQGIGFAIPSDMARDVIAQLREGKSVRRGWIGVTIQDIDDNTAKALGMENTKGALVTSVLEGQPAAKAGVKTGDVITSVSGEKVDDSNQLLRRVATLKPGESAEMTLLRKGQPMTVSVTLGERDAKKLAQQGAPGDENGEDDAAPDKAATVIGLAVRSVTAKEAKALGMDKARGVLITEVGDGTEAEQSDVRPGDVVLEVNQRAVNTPDEFKKVVAEDGKQKGVVMLQIKRQRQTIFRTVPLAESK
ncbi:protease Do [Solidesulfovibrio carbinoliphilus subsp. oakridgensis]|uniref:Probable periplasmic serine endoprotease DegP-like n=1 Tax=Solidesulfovibrio carbinoliphilus subsp. oakridgensis TaxID=694327 RepID=G7Q4E9_9BACT|nr:DegQ family serine endoprotease [Solidesulfovibrio carbinoliphilus]EHJ47172.1 protease Do [Solidesulfovibrio carbinoliphilus subsp. oakridgensis]